MLVNQLMKLVKTRLINIQISKNDEALLSFINMGMSELYNRFNLLIKSETIMINPDLALYDIKNPDVLMLLALFDKTGRELVQTDIVDSDQYDYKLMNYKTFLLRKPFNGYIYAVYKAAPIELADENDLIELPDAMIGALLTYIAYIAYYTINRDNMNESNVYYQQFEQKCNSLENQGYKISLGTERLSLASKGFI